jgi:hypothetical protein
MTDWEKSIEEEEEEEKDKTLGNRMPLTNLRVQLKRATYIALGPLYSS